MAYIGATPTVGNFQVCDAISVVNGQAAYTLQVGGVNVTPESANHMLVSLNGILQKPGSSFTISGSTMTFASNLATGDVIDFVQILGNVLDIGQPSDDTVTAAKLNDDIISGQTALTSEPADTDEFLVSDAGTLKRIDYSIIKGGGKIAQVVSGTLTSPFVTTSSSFVATGLDVDITPSATSSKVFVIATCYLDDNKSAHQVYSTLYRDSTNLGHSSYGMMASYGAGGRLRTNHTMSFLDSPSSTSALNYEVFIKGDGDTVSFNSESATVSITAMEVLA